jgi:hypothetical protein
VRDKTVKIYQSIVIALSAAAIIEDEEAIFG